MLKKILYWVVLVSSVASFGVFVTFVVWLSFLEPAAREENAVWVFFFGPTSKVEIIDNYKDKTQEIWAVKTYINSITPEGKKVTVEFDGDETLEIFHVSDSTGRMDQNWNLDIDDPKTVALCEQLGWTPEMLETLKQKLDAANCISVSSGEPNSIGFQRRMLAGYYYLLFSEPLTDSLRNDYNDGCIHVLYNDSVVLTYGGGAIGPQCWEDYKYRERNR